MTSMKLTQAFSFDEFRCRCWVRGYKDLTTYRGGIAIGIYDTFVHVGVRYAAPWWLPSSSWARRSG